MNTNIFLYSLNKKLPKRKPFGQSQLIVLHLLPFCTAFYSVYYKFFSEKVAQTEAIWAISINSSTPIFLIITQLFMSNNLLLF